MNEMAESMAKALGGSLNEVREKIIKKGLKDDSLRPGGSLEHLYFSLISIATNVKNILEIGTGLGWGTNVLSRLFPDSIIYTIDLPEGIEGYKNSYIARKRKGAQRFHDNITRDNIVFIGSNSFFLPSLELPSRFGFIWVDGSHVMPALAWDMMFAYNHLTVGGSMGMHDYSINCPPNFQGKIIIDYMKSRIKEKILLLPATSDPEESKIAKIAHITKVKG